MGNDWIKWLIGGLIGLVLGLAAGLYYAWMVNPATYSSGAYPNELTDAYQQTYVQAVSEAYLTTRDLDEASNQLRSFSPETQTSLLASVANNMAMTDPTSAAAIGDFASLLSQRNGWSVDQISNGLSAANASKEFSEKLGMTPQQPEAEPGVVTQATATPLADDPGGSSGGSFLRTVLTIFAILLALVAAIFLLTRIKLKPRPKEQPKPEVIDSPESGGSALKPIRQWAGFYTLGEDDYDASFAIETDDDQFLGECGMGILEGFAAPGGDAGGKKVLAFDVWLFDKTDIRTISVPVMSNFAFEDDVFRSKISPDANPVLAAQGTSFDIETTALLVKATIDEVTYGEGPPERSYFQTLKVTLAAYLREGVDTSGPMGIPDAYKGD